MAVDRVRLRDLIGLLPGPVSWDDWPTGELVEDWDEDDNEIEVEETTPVLGCKLPARQDSGFDSVMLFLIDPDGDVSEQTRELIAEGINALPELLDENERLTRERDEALSGVEANVMLKTELGHACDRLERERDEARWLLTEAEKLIRGEASCWADEAELLDDLSAWRERTKQGGQ